MVALQHTYHDQPGAQEPGRLEAARRDVCRLADGLLRALMATPPHLVREVAARTIEAEANAERRLARVGERPALDDEAEAAVRRTVMAHDLARDAHRRALDDRHRLLARGNGVGVGCIAAGVALHSAGLDVLSLPMAVLMLGAAAGPLVALMMGLNRLSFAVRDLALARARWSVALEATGLSTMGAVAARRLAVDGWERKRSEAEVATNLARRQRRAWQVLAGPRVAPSDVEALLGRVDELRAAQLRLLGELLDRRLHTPPPEPALVLHIDEPSVVATPFDEVLKRVRSRTLKLWAQS